MPETVDELASLPVRLTIEFNVGDQSVVSDFAIISRICTFIEISPMKILLL